MMPKEIDYTMLSTFLTCRKKYELRMIRHLVLNVPPTAAEFGRCIHLALDEWHQSKDVKKATEVFNAAYTENPEDDKRTKAVAAKMLQLYHNQYVSDSIKVLATEVAFSLPLPETEINLIGRIDKIIEWDGAVYIMDHKTTSSLGASFFNKIKPNMQFDGYVWAAQQLGYPLCSGVVMDALLVAKGLLVPAYLAKLTPNQRDISERTPLDVTRYLRNVSSIIGDLKSCYAREEWYENTESCCDFVECPYRSICKEDPGIHEAIIKSEYKVEVWDPRREK